jgi:hypothetical protein
MGFLMFVYNIVALIVIFMGCESIFVNLKKWARRENDEGKPIMHWRNAEYFDVFVVILLIFLFYIIINRAGWMDGPLLHFSGEENLPDDRTPADYLR